MEGISKLFGRVRHCFSHSTVGSSKTRQITIRGRGLNTTNHDMTSIGLKECGLTTLETQTLRGDQIEMFKILNCYENSDL